MTGTNKMSDIQSIPAASIMAGNNDRKTFNEQKLRELAASIEANGLAQPPTLRPVNGHYQIVAGERRVRAMRDVLEWTDIPAIVREMDDETASGLMLAENTGRQDLNPIEEAEGYQQRIERYGWDVAKVAQVAGVSSELVNSRLRLLKLAPDVQHFVKHGQLPLGHGEMLHRLDANRQRIALRIYNSAGSLSAVRFKEIADELYQQQCDEAATPLFDLEAFMVQKVEEIGEQPDMKSGKLARPGAPIRRDLPVVRFKANDTTAEIMERYIADLLDKGHLDEAAAVGNLYNTLVGHNWLRLPVARHLRETAFNGTAKDNAHEARIRD